MNNQILQLELTNLTLLNKLYIPICKNGKAAIVKNKQAKEFIKYVRFECLRQRIKPIQGDLSFRCDICIKNRKNFDIDAVLKLLFDSLNGYAYKDDKQIVELIVRKHLDKKKDEIILELLPAP